MDLNVPAGSMNVAKITAVHQGPVRALLRSPFFENVLLSIGIWTFALWRDGIEVRNFAGTFRLSSCPQLT